MARKGANRKQKRLSASRALFASRKTSKWIIATKPGAHAKGNSVPLGFALREILNFAENAKETKMLLNSGKVLVDGKIRKGRNMPLGIFDVVELPEIEKRYRVLFDSRGRIMLKEISAKGKLQKLCRVVGKHATKGNRMQIATNDGRSIAASPADAFSLNDSLLIELPSQKISAKFRMEKNALVYIISGKHVNEHAKILDVGERTMKRPKLVMLENENGNKFSTLAENVFVIGVEKPAIEM